MVKVSTDVLQVASKHFEDLKGWDDRVNITRAAKFARVFGLSILGVTHLPTGTYR